MYVCIVDRVQSFLLEPEKDDVPALPLTAPGVLMKRASLVWARTRSNKSGGNSQSSSSLTVSSYGDALKKMYAGINVFFIVLKEWKTSIQARFSGDVATNHRRTAALSQSEIAMTRSYHDGSDDVNNPLRSNSDHSLVASANGNAGTNGRGYTHLQVQTFTIK